MSKHESNISIKIELDENKIPETITWSAPDGGIEETKTKAFLLSVWDDKTLENLSLGLWTKDMPVDHMKRFYFEILRQMADNYQRATGDAKLSDEMKAFAGDFGVKAGVLKEEK